MKSQSRRFCVFMLTILLLMNVVIACGKRLPQAKGQKKDEKTILLENLKGKIQAKGVYIPWRERGKDGKPINVLSLKAKEALFDKEGLNQEITLKDVQAKVFREGKPAANLIAKQMIADKSSGFVKASGGVTVHSLQKSARYGDQSRKCALESPN